MNRYGQAITWSTLAAPHLFTGACTAYSYREAATRQLIEDEAGDNLAFALHSHKAELHFEAKVLAGTNNFLDLSTGAAVAVSGISAGLVLARRAVETWRLLQPKTAAISATHYPDMTQASPALAGTTLDANTPAQSALGILTPGSVLPYSTYGLSHASGIVHGLTITQELQITEDEPAPDGKLLGAAGHGYLRTISLELLSTAAAPTVGSILTVTGAPAHGVGYKIESVEQRFAEMRGKMYAIQALWIPAMG